MKIEAKGNNLRVTGWATFQELFIHVDDWDLFVRMVKDFNIDEVKRSRAKELRDEAMRNLAVAEKLDPS